MLSNAILRARRGRIGSTTSACLALKIFRSPATLPTLAAVRAPRFGATGIGVASPLGPNVSATMDDGVPTGTYKQNGGTITYTLGITNGGTGDATGVSLTPPTPADTTFVAGSLHASPLAINDAYTAVGNTKLYVGVAAPAGEPARVVSGGLLANDTPITDTTVLVSNTNPSHGAVTVNADGTFVYTPTAGYTGADSFTYTVKNSADATLTDTATVDITVSNIVWYVDNSGANGNGTSTSPFNTLAGAAGASGANSIIYVYKGSGAYSGGLTLKSGQALVSEYVALVVGANTLRTAVPANVPTLSNSAGSTVALASGNIVDGFIITNSAGNGISGSAIGTTAIADIAVAVTGGTALNATTSGTLTVTGTANTLNSTTGTALNVANVTIGAAGLTFLSISAGNNTAAADPTNGIVLNNTGATAGLTVTGGGNAAVGGNSSGGTIQFTAGAGIALTNTRDVSLTNMNIHDTADSGVSGVGVTNFTFKNGTVTAAGNGNADSAIAFNGNPVGTTGAGLNLSGTLTLTQNIFTNAFYGGVDVQADNGALTAVTVSNNTISNPGFAGVNFFGRNTASTGFSIDKATVANNTISSSGVVGIQFSIGGADATGPAVHAGTVTVDGNNRPVGDATNIISITGNAISINSGGNQAITVANTGANSASRTQTNFEIKNNGTVGVPLTGSSIGTDILIGNNGFADMAGVVDSNVINANHTPNGGGGNGIAGGNGTGGTPSTNYTPRLYLTVTNNTISNTDGSGILLVGRSGDGSGQAFLKVANNSATTPLNAGGTARQCIRVEAGNPASVDDAVFLNMTGNTCPGGSNGAAGLGIRKQGTVATTNDFGIAGLSPSPATGPQAAAFVAAQNPAGNGCDAINGDNFVSTTLAPSLLLAPGGVERVEMPEGNSMRARSSPKISPVTTHTMPAGATTGLEVLTQSELDSIVAGALARWQAVGLSDAQVARFVRCALKLFPLAIGISARRMEIHIRVDWTAGGNGWFVGPAPMSDAAFSGRASDPPLHRSQRRAGRPHRPAHRRPA